MTDARVLEILRTGRVNYWTGDVGRAFEEAFAKWLGVAFAVSVVSGAAARRVAFLAQGLDPDSPDGAECPSGEWRGCEVGYVGRVTFFGFRPDAAITAGGSGGMVCTDDEALAWEMRSLRDHGYDARRKIDLLKREGRTLYAHRCVGYNFRLTEIQSAIGLGELECLARRTRRSRAGELAVKLAR